MMVAVVALSSDGEWSLSTVGIIIFFIILLFVSKVLFSLVQPILYPTVLSHPWPLVKRTTTNDDEQTIAIMAGSFNPPHLGHWTMLQYLSQRYAKVICIVGCNPKKTYQVTPQERAELLKTMMTAEENNNETTIQVQVVSGFIWLHAKKNILPQQQDSGKPLSLLFVRGIRSWETDGPEERTLQIQNTWGPLCLGWTWPIPTLYLEGKPEYNSISSTLVRNMILQQDGNRTSLHQSLSKLIPGSIVDQVIQLYGRTSPNVNDATATEETKKEK